MTAVAGKLLDAEIAERFFGYRWWRSRSTGRRCIYAPDRVPEHMLTLADKTEPLVVDWDRHQWTDCYSTDIRAAFLIFDVIYSKDAERGWLFSKRRKFYAELERLCSIDARPAFPPREMGFAEYDACKSMPVAWPDALGIFRERMPEFICLAALAVESWSHSSMVGLAGKMPAVGGV